ncbi:hypothetical protein RN001_012541 [Aquatica leii]|uniref:EF-hand domain-containing protein n=1 Tax=Aquatica leii TaxID=1421715 RepID=A0AAN7SF84_9COLE|nr:hypothetical protein RN001_012541 [Aquatica leii]
MNSLIVKCEGRDRKGYVSINDIRRGLKEEGEKDVSKEELHEILKEIDTNMNGQVELDEYLQFSARINMSGNPGPSRMHPDDSGFEKWCTDLLEDEDCVISDEDEDPDFIIESEHDSDSEMSAGEEGDENLDTGPGGAQTQENFYYGRQKLQKIKQNVLDASSKISAGLLEGNVHDFGSFDECLKIKENLTTHTLLGKYCIIGISTNISFFSDDYISHIPIAHIFRAFCIPDSCSTTDINVMFNSMNVSVLVLERSCQTQNYGTDIDSVTLPILIFFGIVLLIVVISTVYTFLVENCLKAKVGELASAFSILKNGKKLFSTSKNSNQISCMYGMRVISMMWILLGHLHQVRGIFPMHNGFTLLKSYSEHKFDYLIGGNKTVDTFLLLTGITLSYVFLSAAQHHKFNLIVFYFHRYLRLTPALGAVVLVYLGLFQYISSGPFWAFITATERDHCSQNWWKTIFYINNYGYDQCIPHTWYLSVDMQLFVIAPFILLLLQKKPYLGLSLIGVLGAIVTAVTMAITWINDIDSNGAYTNKYNFMTYYYEKTYTRATPWFIGMAAGYIIYKTQQKQAKVVMNSTLVAFLWIVSLSYMTFFSFYQFESYHYDMYEKIQNSMYNGFVRSLWSIAVGWIIFACHFGYGSFINTFLSLPVFQILSKLTYTNYLVHMIFVLVSVASMRVNDYFLPSKLYQQFWGVYMYTQAASIVLSLCFESPIIILEKLLFSKKTETSKQKVLEK